MSTIQTAILNGSGLRFVPTVACTLSGAAQDEPADGVYTITRTYRGHQALLLERHLDRLENSARLEGIPLQLDRAALRAALRQMIARGGYPESRFRVTVPRSTPHELYLALEPLKPVAGHLREQGVKVITIDAQRENPASKTTDWFHARAQWNADLPPDVYETLLVSAEGHLLEGSSSNFYAICAGTCGRQARASFRHLARGVAGQRRRYAAYPREGRAPGCTAQRG
ncbi:MAG: hypothetical protein HC915_07275 [Anaerolineae bacterium]|nr:hypothetical protein [Anaerolineae bacterium]